MVGKPWERVDRIGLREIASGSKEYGGQKLKTEHLRELGELFDKRRRDELRWILDDDMEVEEGWLDKERPRWEPVKRLRSEADAIRFLIDRYVIPLLNFHYCCYMVSVCVG